MLRDNFIKNTHYFIAFALPQLQIFFNNYLTVLKITQVKK